MLVRFLALTLKYLANKVEEVNPFQFLTKRQCIKMSGNPEMIWQVGGFLHTPPSSKECITNFISLSLSLSLTHTHTHTHTHIHIYTYTYTQQQRLISNHIYISLSLHITIYVITL